MYKRTSLFILLIFLTGFLFAQKSIHIELTSSKEKSAKVKKVQVSPNGLILKESFSSIGLIEKETKGGLYRQLMSQGMSKTFDAGKPDLPVVTKLIEIPNNSKATVKIVSYDEQIIELKDYAIFKKIIPAQPSVVKNKDPKDETFHKDQKIYKKNSFFKKDLVRFVDKGFLRNKHLGYIEISPFQYNPVTNTLKVLNNIEVEVNFIADKSKSVNTKTLQSPYFKNVTKSAVNQTTESKSLISGPVKYVIVSDPMFELTLQPFIEWKTMKGFNVIAAYTNDPGVGNTTTSIKAYLQDLYDNPTDGISPTFVLLVGDVAQIPSFSGTTGGHVTDLYYCEYTGDKLPEVFYGRFSAESIAELQPQIDKTLLLEKYQMPDPSYLDKVVLVAGVDGTYGPTHANGAVNYLNSNYTNAANGLTSYYYLYNDASGVMSSNSAGASESIRSNISQGISFSNYTAHCSSSGWADPGFNISNIDGLANTGMYPLLIGNCCQSNKFNVDDCFGEEVVKAANKGAVGYIGGSADTYWDEDYYWGVGLVGSIIANPTYAGSGLGAFDRFFHLNGEAKQDWYITQGQINVAGNLAVEASASSLKSYYWEIYHLMGDPSLIPYITVPSALTATYNSTIFIGTDFITVTTEEDAYVAISFNGELLGANIVDASGIVTIYFDALTLVGELDIVITKQNRQPVIDTIIIVPINTPYVILENYIIDDIIENNNNKADFGESLKLNVKLKNISETYDAFLVNAIIETTDTNVVFIDSVETYGIILHLDDSLCDAAFSLEVKSEINDQHTVECNIKITGEDSGGIAYEWNSKLKLVLNAPKIEIEELLIDDSNGNNDGIFDPGENVILKLIVSNLGNSKINSLEAFSELLTDNSYINIIDTEINNITIEANSSDTINFSASVHEDEKPGNTIDLKFIVRDQFYNYYKDSVVKEIRIGKIEECTINELSSVTVGTQMLFYDSGGKDRNYSNDENYTITFYPENPRNKLKVDFRFFDVESKGSGGCYDYLTIYDGDSSIATIIDSYCNEIKPTVYTATNELGALTFNFYSDGSITRAGWEATVQNIGHLVKFVVADSNGPIENVTVEFNNEEKYTNLEGIVTFNYVTEGTDLPYDIRKLGYENYVGTISVSGNTDVEVKDTTIRINMSINTAVEDVLDGNINVYPNPSEGLFYVEINGSKYSQYIINVYDVLGSVVFSKERNGFENLKEQINISNNTKGIYFLVIRSKEGLILTRKLLVN